MTDPVTPAPAAPANGAAPAQAPNPAPPSSPAPAPSAPAGSPPATPAAPPSGAPGSVGAPAQPTSPPVAPATPGPDAGKGGAAPGSKPETPASPSDAAKASAPAEYSLTAPKDSLVSAQRLDAIKASAKERGLSNEQAQAELERENQTLSDYAKAQVETLKQVQATWATQAQSDPEIGGERFKENIELAKRVVDRFGTPALKQELEATRYGDHPEVVRLLHRIGRAMAPDQLVIPEAGSGPRKYAKPEDLYDHPTSRKG